MVAITERAEQQHGDVIAKHSETLAQGNQILHAVDGIKKDVNKVNEEMAKENTLKEVVEKVSLPFLIYSYNHAWSHPCLAWSNGGDSGEW